MQPRMINIAPRPRSFFFVGIGGIGMSGLAEILLEMGHRVSGSDRQKTDLTDYLEQRGAVVYEGHRAEHVQNVDYLVRSSAVPMDNPEVAEATRRGIPVMRRAELLGQLFNRKFGIAVAGTHGKTTTTSMLGHCLLKGGFDPTIVVGGRLRNLKTNARLGKGDILVAEADEYDRSFLTLFPRIAVMTSLEMDHQDIYSDLHDLEDAFLRFSRQIVFDGVLIVNQDDANLRRLRDKFTIPMVSFGLEQAADYRAQRIDQVDRTTSFEVVENGQELGRVHLNVPGLHNVKNALAAIAVCRELNMEFEEIKDALVQFEGVERRFETLGEEQGIMIVDDYAHHPTEVEATLRTAKEGFSRRVVAVFQPHLFSRTAQFYREFARALSLADVAVVTDVYPAREKPLPGITGQMIADLLETEGYWVKEKNEIPAFLES
ncbi:MAG TPA: UDP-N-acetylmuramate--L-alanine ligase, partial [Caldithrix abyssi]|nr:UDP-N-acetylmuramate--L-alanine ligase [Caldithrix abyssi]